MREELDFDTVKNFAASSLPFKVAFIEPVAEGVSTNVYKIGKDDGVSYLRLSSDDHFGPEVKVHETLLAKGVKIPKVEYFEDYDENLGSSLVVVSEIKGQSLDKVVDASEHLEVLKDAGRDLAVVNSVEVKKFGWINKDKGATDLVGTFDSYFEYAQVELEERLAKITEANLLNTETATEIRRILTNPDNFKDIQTPRLTHGDFAASHIFEDQGQYSGIIDFSDLKGTSGFSDLAHLRIYNPELFEGVLTGFKEVTPLPENFNQILTIELLIVALEKLNWVLSHTPKEQIRDTEAVAIKKTLKE